MINEREKQRLKNGREGVRETIVREEIVDGLLHVLRFARLFL